MHLNVFTLDSKFTLVNSKNNLLVSVLLVSAIYKYLYKIDTCEIFFHKFSSLWRVISEMRKNINTIDLMIKCLKRLKSLYFVLLIPIDVKDSPV